MILTQYNKIKMSMYSCKYQDVPYRARSIHIGYHCCLIRTPDVLSSLDEILYLTALADSKNAPTYFLNSSHNKMLELMNLYRLYRPTATARLDGYVRYVQSVRFASLLLYMLDQLHRENKNSMLRLSGTFSLCEIVDVLFLTSEDNQ